MFVAPLKIRASVKEEVDQLARECRARPIARDEYGISLLMLSPLKFTEDSEDLM
jgi:hypothetical protein